jgi:hypothetical protein
MRSIRALPEALFSEFSEPGDMHHANPGELLSIPTQVCDEDGAVEEPPCMCRKMFLGLSSSRPTTLALVCEEDETVVYEESDESNAVPFEPWMHDGVMIQGPRYVHKLARHFTPGCVVRLCRYGHQVWLDDCLNEEAVYASSAQ